MKRNKSSRVSVVAVHTHTHTHTHTDSSLKDEKLGVMSDVTSRRK